MIVRNRYDELGQLIGKGTGGKTTQTALQNVDYAYNIRGWLKAINDVNNIGTVDLFAFKLGYNEGTTPLYNGNISLTQWKTRNTDSSLKTYNYTYDALNRITNATDNTGRYNLTGVSYDKNGNILTLQRQGHTDANATLFGSMDNLVYDYAGGDNKLTKVSDNGNVTYGFKDGTNVGDDFTYDQNGNMKTDANKGITNITYNHLNLPASITFKPNSYGVPVIRYVYDATGAKLSKSVATEFSDIHITAKYDTIQTTQYTGMGFVYEKVEYVSYYNHQYYPAELQFFNTAEGYVEPNGTGWQYVYQYKDHLGNVRLSYADADGDGLISPSFGGGQGEAEIREENNFYPFGLKHKGYNNAIGGSRDHKYGFGNKEEQDELGLGWIDITARNYDPALGRWMNLDLLAEAYLDISPYVYAANNPVFFIDPDGLSIGLGNIFKKNKRGEFVNPELAEAFTIFAQSDLGKEFLSLFAEGGQEFELADGSSLSFDEDGQFHKEGFDLNFNAANINSAISNDSMTQGNEGSNGDTSNPFMTAEQRKNNKENVNKGSSTGTITITLNTQLNENNGFAKRFKDNPNDPEARLLFILSRTMTIFHEMIIHAYPQALDITDNCRVDCSNFSRILFPGYSETFEQHKQARQEGSLFLKRTTPAMQKIFRNAGKPKTSSEIKKLLLNYRD